eukprot:COSAG01_NODE_2784_length_7083_cov_306.080756_3_plen_158_part_00
MRRRLSERTTTATAPEPATTLLTVVAVLLQTTGRKKEREEEKGGVSFKGCWEGWVLCTLGVLWEACTNYECPPSCRGGALIAAERVRGYGLYPVQIQDGEFHDLFSGYSCSAGKEICAAIIETMASARSRAQRLGDCCHRHPRLLLPCSCSYSCAVA